MAAAAYNGAASLSSANAGSHYMSGTRRGSITDPLLHAHSAALPAETELGRSPGTEAHFNFSYAYPYPRRDSVDPYRPASSSGPGDRRGSALPSLADGVQQREAYGFPMTSNVLGKRKMEDGPHVQDELATPVPHPAQEAYGINWNKRRSSAFSDGGARFTAMNLNSRRESLASNESDLRRGSSNSNSSGYASAYSSEAYPYTPSGPGFAFQPSLLPVAASDGTHYGTDVHPSVGAHQFATYGFPSGPTRSPTSTVDTSLPPTGTTQGEHSPTSGQSPFQAEREPSDPSRVFPGPTTHSAGGSTEPSPADLLAAGKAKETPYSRSPEMRVSHKMAERKRRKEMAELFSDLRESLPVDRGVKASKWETLTAAIEHIRHMNENAQAARAQIFDLQNTIGRMQQQQQQMGTYTPPPGHYVNLPPTSMGQPLPSVHPSPMDMLPPQHPADDQTRPPWPTQPRQMTM